MALPFLKPQEQTSALLVFGKLPSQPDFVRINAIHPVAQELDELLQVAMESIAAQEGWQDRYDATPPSDLVYTSYDGRWQFQGLFQPSRDQAGRRFPILAGTVHSAQETKKRGLLIPIAREGFFAALRTQLGVYGRKGASDLDCREFLELGDIPWDPDPSEWELAEGIRARLLEEQSAGDFEATLFDPSSDRGLRQAILNMAFYRDFLQRFPSPSAAQLIELPLGTGPGETALHATIWLSILSALGLLEGQVRECALVTLDHPRARLSVSVGRGLGRLLASGLGQPLPPESYLDIRQEQSTWQAHRLYAQSAYAVDRLIEDPALRLAHLLNFLSDLRQKIAFASH